MKTVHYFSIIHDNSSYRLIHDKTDITRWAKGYFRTRKLARDISTADDLEIFFQEIGRKVFSFYYVSPLIFGSTTYIVIPYITLYLSILKIFFMRIYWLGLYEGYPYIRKQYYRIVDNNDFQKLYWKMRIKAIKFGLMKGRAG